VESDDTYTRRNADEAEELVHSGIAMLARSWLEDQPDRRRIGETIHSHISNASLARIKSHLDAGLEEMWVDEIAVDDQGQSYAQREIWKLPSRKSRRSVVFRGLAIHLKLSGFPPIEDIGQKYVIVSLPSAERVKEIQSQLGGKL
jgi:hypothetical protein